MKLTALLAQNDEWGKKGQDSVAGRLWSQMPGGEKLDDSKHYSEVSPGFIMTKETLSDRWCRCGWVPILQIPPISFPPESISVNT